MLQDIFFQSSDIKTVVHTALLSQRLGVLVLHEQYQNDSMPGVDTSQK